MPVGSHASGAETPFPRIGGNSASRFEMLVRLVGQVSVERCASSEIATDRSQLFHALSGRLELVGAPATERQCGWTAADCCCSIASEVSGHAPGLLVCAVSSTATVCFEARG
jgi:hypothetical protein